MPDPKTAKRPRLRLILALAGVGLTLIAGLLWLNRRSLAREALTGWLKDKGVAAQADVQAFGPTTFTARLTLGDPKHPDFVAERATVRYRLGMGGLTVDRVELTRPVLRASLYKGRLAAGSLDPLIQEFLRRPPPPGAKLPGVQVDGGVLLLATDYGPVRISGDVRVDDGKLQSLSATSAPARLRGKGFDVTVGSGALTEVTRAGRINATLVAPVSQLAAGGASAADGRLEIRLDAPYPDLVKRRGDGKLVGSATLAARKVALPGGRGFERVGLAAAFVGDVKGWIPDLAVSGRATATLDGDGGLLGGAGVDRANATLVADDVRWTRTGGDRVTARLQFNGGVDTLTAGDLKLSGVTLVAAGPLAATPQTFELSLKGSALGRGAFAGMGAPVAADTAGVVAMKRAVRAFRFAAPAFSTRVAVGPPVGREQVRELTYGGKLDQPLAIRADSGGEARLAMESGAFHLTTRGGGLPVIDARIKPLTLSPELTADVAVKARLSVAVAEDATVDADGRLRFADGRLSFTGTRCAAFSAARLELGANDVERLSGRLCPAGAPFFSGAGGDWRVIARAEAVAAAIPFAEIRLNGVDGRLDLSSRRGRLGAAVDLTGGRLEDTARAARFATVEANGRITLADYVWTGDIAVRQPKGAQIARAHLVHDGGLGLGFVSVDTGVLTFAEGGLQPIELSPAASAIGSPVTGSADFSGRFDWARQGASSSGRLILKDLSFQSPAGRVEGMSGTVALESLAPLRAAPGQTLEIAKVESIVPLTNLHARFALADNVLRIEGGEAQVGGGRILVETLEAPLVAGAPAKGVLVFEGVQLHDLVEASPFGDKVELDARVSGRLVFETDGDKVKIESGELQAIQPGRLMIDRAALTGVSADSATPVPAVADPNATFTDFAYQAMENLAFDKLTATIATRRDGRLGVLFHIVGKHDPPQKQRIKLTVMDLIQKRFLGRKLPLPSGTGVDLTLDTSLNLDDLLADYANFRRLHGSGEVQP